MKKLIVLLSCLIAGCAADVGVNVQGKFCKCSCYHCDDTVCVYCQCQRKLDKGEQKCKDKKCHCKASKE